MRSITYQLTAAEGGAAQRLWMERTVRPARSATIAVALAAAAGAAVLLAAAGTAPVTRYGAAAVIAILVLSGAAAAFAIRYARAAREGAQAAGEVTLSWDGRTLAISTLGGEAVAWKAYPAWMAEGELILVSPDAERFAAIPRRVLGNDADILRRRFDPAHRVGRFGRTAQS